MTEIFSDNHVELDYNWDICPKDDEDFELIGNESSNMIF